MKNSKTINDNALKKQNILLFLENRTDDYENRIALAMKTQYGWKEFTYKGLGYMSRKVSSYLINNLQVKKGDKVLVIIGPEGGFSKREFDYFKYGKTSEDSSHSVIQRVKPEESTTQNDKIEMLTLGDLILKADTAVVVGLGNVIYEYANSKR